MDLFEAVTVLLCIFGGLFVVEKVVQWLEKEFWNDDNDLGTGF